MSSPTSSVESTDVAVIGAGPIGLELAVALKRAGVDYLHFDAKQIGYTISWFAPQTRFFSSNERIAIAGVPLQTWDQSKSTREEYLAYLRQIVIQFDLKVRTYEPVVGIERRGDGFALTTNPSDGPKTIHAKRIVLCTGGTDRPRRLNVPGEDLPHVSHYFQDPHTYFRRRLLIVGGKNSAVEAALRCHHAGADVSLSYRRDQLNASSIKYWLLPEINGLIGADKIHGYFGTMPRQITPSHVTLCRSSYCTASDSTNDRALPFDFVLLLIGYEADLSLLKKAGVELRGDCQAPVFNEHTMETNVPGVYVAGCAVGGTQDKFAIFLENCHIHVPRIVAALTGHRADLPVATPEFDRPET
jgi:thioredoxin reductase (NADPH)